MAITDAECLAHAPPNERERVLGGVPDGQELTFTRGLTIDDSLLGELVARAASADTERPTLVGADFSRATFVDVTAFKQISFARGASFEGAVFEQPVFMTDCSFGGDAYFSRARFRSNAFFGYTRFTSGTFERASFERGADFSGCEFDSLSLYGTQSRGTLSLPAVVIHDEASIGPVFSADGIRLDGSHFQGVATIEVAARELTCMATTFDRAVLIRARRALVVLDHAVFRQPSALAANVGVFERAPADYDQGDLFDEAPLKDLGLPHEPSLVSLDLVDASRLSMSGVNLSTCLFRGARNLDALRIEGSRTFGRTPTGVRFAWAWPPVRWWTRRHVVADEAVWRTATQPKEPDRQYHERETTRTNNEAMWRQPVPIGLLSDRSYGFVSASVASDPASIADIYRSLRKADENAGNEAGAADFYYGEMEMRRASADCPPSERLLLFLYWLVSGYGLRASRALVALVITIFVFALGLRAWGFTSPTTLTSALIYSTNATVSLLRAPQRDLTDTGQVMDIALRLIGPLLFGLILLAIRGRVKR